MSEIKVAQYIEQKYKQWERKFADLEWLKTYLGESVQGELHLIDSFFLATCATCANERFLSGTAIGKWACANKMNAIFCALTDQPDSKLLCEVFIESNTTDEKLAIVSTLSTFLIQDLLNLVIEYSLSTRFEVGMYIDALDADDEWDICEIKRILRYKNNIYLLIHYLECSDWYDECILANSERIRLLYDDTGQIVYKWAKIVYSEVEEVDYRVRGQCNWNYCANHHTRGLLPLMYEGTDFAPAGTFCKAAAQQRKS